MRSVLDRTREVQPSPVTPSLANRQSKSARHRKRTRAGYSCLLLADRKSQKASRRTRGRSMWSLVSGTKRV